MPASPGYKDQYWLCPSFKYLQFPSLNLVKLLVASLASSVVLATGVAASPFSMRDSSISLSITKHTNVTVPIDFNQRDQARFKYLVHGPHQSTSSISNLAANIDLGDSAFVYFVSVGVGIPPTFCEPYRFLPRMVSYMPV